MKRLGVAGALFFAACQTTAPGPQTPPMNTTNAPQLVIAPDIAQRVKQLPRTVIDYNRSLLTDNDRQVIAKLIEASKQIDEIYWRQVSEENPDLRTQLQKIDGPAYEYFVMNRGPWDRLKQDEPF